MRSTKVAAACIVRRNVFQEIVRHSEYAYHTEQARGSVRADDVKSITSEHLRSCSVTNAIRGPIEYDGIRRLNFHSGASNHTGKATCKRVNIYMHKHSDPSMS